MFEDLTAMLDLAFALAPLLFLIVVAGAAFKILSQFRKGDMY